MRKNQQEKKEKIPKPPKVKKEPSSGEKVKIVDRLKDFFRNRTVIGFLCIVVGLLVGFVAVPAVQNHMSQRVPVIVAASDIESGALITYENIKVSDVGALDRHANAAVSPEQVVGTYAKYSILAGDTLTSQKLSYNRPQSNQYLYELPEGKSAISVSIGGLAEGLTGKLKAGDIVSVYAVFNGNGNAEDYAAVQPPELKYVEVLALSNSLGQDIDIDAESILPEGTTGERDHLPATITLLAGKMQAAALAGINHNSIIHVALVARAEDEPRRTAFLAEQEAYILQEEIAALAAKMNVEASTEASDSQVNPSELPSDADSSEENGGESDD